MSKILMIVVAGRVRGRTEAILKACIEWNQRVMLMIDEVEKRYANINIQDPML